jgi:hypothetical protein
VAVVEEAEMVLVEMEDAGGSGIVIIRYKYQ